MRHALWVPDSRETAMTDMMDHRVADRNGSLGLRLRDSLARLAAHLRAGDAQKVQRQGCIRLSEDNCRDIGMSSEDATGIREWRAELPFFMQTGFGRR